MSHRVPPPRSPRNPLDHLALAAGDPEAFEALFAAVPGDDDIALPEDLDDARLDMLRDLAADRRRP